VALFSLSFSAPNDHLLLSRRSHALFRLNRLQAALEDADAVVRLCPLWGKVSEFCIFMLLGEVWLCEICNKSFE